MHMLQTEKKLLWCQGARPRAFDLQNACKHTYDVVFPEAWIQNVSMHALAEESPDAFVVGGFL